MRVKVSKSKNGYMTYAIIKDIVRGGKRSTKVVENLGRHDDIQRLHPEMEPLEWAKQHLEQLKKQEAEGKVTIIQHFNQTQLIQSNQQPLVDIGYLFIEKIFHQLQLPKLCRQLNEQHQFTYDLTTILSTLIATRILAPTSKRASLATAQTFLEKPSFDLQHVYRSLDVLAQHTLDIQRFVYHSSRQLTQQHSHVLFYDCTNFFFETEEAVGLRQYGKSKEHRPNPIVQMGLFMDSNGLPLAFSIFPGNQNEQQSLKPLEKQIIRDYQLSKLVICTDAGLSSTANRRFNNIANRSFITTQSLKKLKKELQEWALSPTGWRVRGSKKRFDLREISEEHAHELYYKEQWIPAEKNGVEQRLIVTFSPKHRAYQQSIREQQITRALNKMDTSNPLCARSQHDPARFIQTTNITDDGVVASKKLYQLDIEQINKEAKFDGFYGLCTNLEDDVNHIIHMNHRRWEIEEAFRIMKHEFKARPVYVSKDHHIQAHFLICFLALLIFRIMEQQLNFKYSCHQIIDQLNAMKLFSTANEGYSPAYSRNTLTDLLHEKFGFRTDYQIMDHKYIKKLLKTVKSK